MSTVTKISSQRVGEQSSQEELSANFGLSDAFSSLLSIGFSGKQQQGTTSKDQDTMHEERVHTPSSLLYELTKDMKSHVHDWTSGTPCSGDFVIFNGKMRRSPILQAMETMAEFLKMMPVFQEMSDTNTKGKSKKKEDGLVKLISSITNQLKADGTRDLIVDGIYKNYKAILTVEEQFLSDKSMANLVDGTFKLFGKVVTVIPDSDASISLLRKTLYDNMPIMKQNLLDAIKNSGNQANFDFEEIEYEIEGPVFQIIPVAIYS